MAWNGSESKGAANVPKKPAKAPPSKLRGLLALALIVAGAGAAWLFMRPASPPEERGKGPAKPSAIAEVAPQIATNVNEVRPPEPKKPEKPAFVKRPGALQLPDGQVLTFPTPKEGEVRKVYAYGHLYECDHLGNFRDISTRKLFHTAFEANFLALSCEGKSFIPAFLTGLDQKEVEKILQKNYQPIGDETEEEMQQLKNYDEMRCAALSYMEQGGSFDDFVNDIVKFEKDQKQAQVVSLREIMTLCKEGKMAEAKEMAEAANVMMQQKGYKPVRLPPGLQEKFDALP